MFPAHHTQEEARVGLGARLHKGLAGVYEVSAAGSVSRNLPMEGLRGLAVILVFFVHYHFVFKPWINTDSHTFAISNFLGTIGLSGVDLFFVISGYLIYGLTIRKPGRYLTFIKRRMQRIYPTFLCVFALYLLLSAVLPSENKIPGEPLAAVLYILANVLLLPGLFDIHPIITVAWSLSYEFFYYILIPLLVFTLGMRRWQSKSRVLFFSTLALLYTFYCLIGSRPHFHLLMFVSGILLYEAIHSYNLGDRLSPRFDYVALFVLLLSFPVFYVLIERPELTLLLSGHRQAGAVFSILVLFFSFFIFTLSCFTSRSLLRRMFSWTPLRWLGNMSYSYYLIHGLTLKGIGFIVLRLIAPGQFSTAAFWIGYPVFFFVTLVSSTILFVLVERRFSILPSGSKAKQSVVASSGEEPLASLSSEGKSATVERLAGSI